MRMPCGYSRHGFTRSAWFWNIAVSMYAGAVWVHVDRHRDPLCIDMNMQDLWYVHIYIYVTYLVL